MALSSTRTFKAFQSFRISAGTFTQSSGDVGGTIDTGLKSIAFAGVSCSSHIGTENAKVSWSGGTLTIVTDDNVSGYWWAIGRV